MTNYLITVNGEEIALTKSDIEALDSIKIEKSNFHILNQNAAHEIQVQELMTNRLRKWVCSQPLPKK